METLGRVRKIQEEEETEVCGMLAMSLSCGGLEGGKVSHCIRSSVARRIVSGFNFSGYSLLSGIGLFELIR